jgi:seryl-tRNA synthetase
MLDINAVRETQTFIKSDHSKKGEASLVDKLLHVDEKRRTLVVSSSPSENLK